MSKDIVLVTDYHDRQIEYRWFNRATGEERTFARPTEVEAIRAVLTQAQAAAQAQGGQVVWIMEATTGWARMQALVGDLTEFLSVNVLQIPLPPKARRKKTDKLDTARLLREYLRGELPLADQPPRSLRRLRRLVDAHQHAVRRQTLLRNRLHRYLRHETWRTPPALATQRGRRELGELVQGLRGWDRTTLASLAAEVVTLAGVVADLEARLARVGRRWAPARRLDAIRGIGPVGAAAIAARIGNIHRFRDADALISFAGLAPSTRQSDQTCRHGAVGGGGTDRVLRLYLIEAAVWAREIPRYAGLYERMCQRRGKKVARLVVARALLRSIDVLLRYGRNFEARRVA